MKIKVAYNLYREMRFLRAVLRTFSKNMTCGNYRLLPCMRVLVLDTYENLSVANVYFGNKAKQEKFQPFISGVNRIKYFRNEKGEGLYSAIYIANNNHKCREIKLFSFETKKILTICTSKEEKYHQFERHERYSCGYSMPSICHSDITPSAYEISMVELLPRPNEILALNDIIKSGISFSKCHAYSSRITLRDALKVEYTNEEVSKLLWRMVSHIDESVLGLSVPICLQHGDLSKENLIYGKSNGREKYWWIDWEHDENRVFFYDVFFYILNAAFCSNDKKPLDLYFKGEADFLFKEFFEFFGLEYSPQKRQDYFLAFAVIFLKERVCDNNNVKTLKQYCSFINDCLKI